MDWDGLRLVLEVARAGSFLQAARALGVATSTVSRQVTALEEELGVMLLERGAEGCRLTAHGERFAALARETERGLDRLLGALGGELEGAISLTCGDGFVPIVAEAIVAFRRVHPGCRFEVRADAEFSRVSRGEVDLAIRTVHLGEPSLVYKKLADVPYGYFAHPSLYAACQRAEPSSLPFVSMAPPLDRMAQLMAASSSGFVQVVCRVNTFGALLDAVRAGVGISALPRATSAGLIEVFPALKLPSATVFLAARGATLRQPHVRAFVEVLKDGARRAALVGVHELDRLGVHEVDT